MQLSPTVTNELREPSGDYNSFFRTFGLTNENKICFHTNCSDIYQDEIRQTNFTCYIYSKKYDIRKYYNRICKMMNVYFRLWKHELASFELVDNFPAIKVTIHIKQDAVCSIAQQLLIIHKLLRLIIYKKKKEKFRNTFIRYGLSSHPQSDSVISDVDFYYDWFKNFFTEKVDISTYSVFASRLFLDESLVKQIIQCT